MSYRISRLFSSMRVAIRPIVVSLSVLFVSCSSPTASATTPATPTGMTGGISPGSSWENAFPLEAPTQQSVDIQTMIADNVHWLRVDVSRNDTLMADATHAGIHVDAVIDMTGQTVTTTPSYMDEVVRQVAPLGVHTYEVGNEVNYHWAASTYVPILKAAYTEIHKQDPQAFVMASGLGPSSNSSGCAAFADYVTQMYQAGAKGYFDAIALHPYTWPQPANYSGCSNPFEYGVPSVRAVMVTNGDSGKDIILTEVGGPTGTDGGYGPQVYTEAQLAQAISTFFSQSKTWGYVGNVFVYNWIDQHNADGDFGLYYSAYVPKPDVLSAFTTSVQ